MPTLRNEVMHKLYQHDVWVDFVPEPSAVVQGWNGNHPSLQRIAATTGSKIVVDVGVWKGQSTINMAMAMKEAGIDGVVVAVDTFLGSLEHWDMGLFARVNGRPDLYSTFLSNVIHAGVQEYVIPVPQTSVTAVHVLARLDIRPTVVHIDAAHEYEEVIRDAEEYWSILAPGGWLIGDDYDENWPGVVKGAAEFSLRVARPLSIEPPKWIVHKPALTD